MFCIPFDFWQDGRSQRRAPFWPHARLGKRTITFAAVHVDKVEFTPIDRPLPIPEGENAQ